MRYEYYGWIFYAGRLAFNFAQQGLANFLLLSVVTLSIFLEIEKLMNESKQIRLTKNTLVQAEQNKRIAKYSIAASLDVLLSQSNI